MSADPFIAQSDDSERGLPELLDLHAQSICGRIHTGLVCRVESFTASKRAANVQPVIQGRYINGDRFTLPVLPNVPIHYPGSSDFEMTFPLVAGDFVFVSFNERSIDEWKSEGGANIAPQDLRRFNVSDGLIVARVEPPGSTQTVSANMTIGQRSPTGMHLTFYPNGKVTLGDGSDELLDIFDQLLAALEAFTLATKAAAVEPTLGPAALTLETAIKLVTTGIRAQLGNIKGP